LDRTRALQGARLAANSVDWGDLRGPQTNVRTIVPRIARRRVAHEFRVVLIAKQRDTVLRAIWKR
jgi:hypothetical protein